MTNNPHLHYRTDVFMSKPIPVTLSAADWLCLMTYFMTLDNLDGATYIVAQISEQLTPAIYTQASLKAADAAFNERSQQHPFQMVIDHLTGQHMPRPEDFNDEDSEG